MSPRPDPQPDILSDVFSIEWRAAACPQKGHQSRIVTGVPALERNPIPREDPPPEFGVVCIGDSGETAHPDTVITANAQLNR